MAPSPPRDEPAVQEPHVEGDNNEQEQDENNEEQADQPVDPIPTVWSDFRTMPLYLIGFFVATGMMLQSMFAIVNWVFAALCAASFFVGAACGIMATSQYEVIGFLANYCGRYLKLSRAVCHMPMERFVTASETVMSGAGLVSGAQSVVHGVEAVANAMAEDE